MGRERAKRNGILPAGTTVDGRWGVVGNLVQRFATTTVLRVRCANPFDAGVGRRRRRWGVLWCGPTSRLVRGRGESVVGWGGLGATSVPGFLNAASTTARNHATLLLLNHPNSHVPHLMLHTVLVGRVPSHRLPPLRDLSIHSWHIHSAQSASPLAPPLVRNPNIVCSRPCQAKCHTGPCPPCTIKITCSCGCGGTTRSLPCHQIHNSGPSNHPAEERSCAIAHARFSALVADNNVLGCVVPAFSRYLSPRERNALGQRRKMGMGLGLGKS